MIGSYRSSGAVFATEVEEAAKRKTLVNMSPKKKAKNTVKKNAEKSKNLFLFMIFFIFYYHFPFIAKMSVSFISATFSLK